MSAESHTMRRFVDVSSRIPLITNRGSVTISKEKTRNKTTKENQSGRKQKINCGKSDENDFLVSQLTSENNELEVHAVS
jgi:hypothetical protein